MAIHIVETILFSAMAGATVLAMIESVRRSSQQQQHYYFLTGLLSLLLLNALGELFMATGGYQYAPHLAGAQLPIRMLIGPALYLYAHSMMSSEKGNTTRTYLIAMLGPLSIQLIMLPFMRLSAEQKLALADPLTRDADLFRLATTTCIMAAIIFIIFMAAYLLKAFKLQQLHRQRMMQQYANIETRSLDWLKIMLLVWGLAWLLFTIDLALRLAGWQSSLLSILLALSEAAALITFAHLALNQRAVLDIKTQDPVQPAPSKSFSLPAERMARIEQKLRHKMHEDKLFCENELSLRRLAEVTSTSEHHLSETFSKQLNCNFFNFVNQYRIEEAKRLLSTTTMPIIDIGFEVGFNSRSTFNAIFKNATTLTPSGYRKQHSPTLEKAMH